MGSSFLFNDFKVQNFLGYPTSSWPPSSGYCLLVTVVNLFVIYIISTSYQLIIHTFFFVLKPLSVHSTLEPCDLGMQPRRLDLDKWCASCSCGYFLFYESILQPSLLLHQNNICIDYSLIGNLWLLDHFVPVGSRKTALLDTRCGVSMVFCRMRVWFMVFICFTE